MGFRFALSGATARRVGGLGETDGTTEGVVIVQDGESVRQADRADGHGNGRERTAVPEAMPEAVGADREIGGE